MKFNTNEEINVVQNISTKGASDASYFLAGGQLYLVIGYHIDDRSDTNLLSQVIITGCLLCT